MADKHQLLVGNCLEVLAAIQIPKNAIFVTDPPFNIGYKYGTYVDKMDKNDYFQMLTKLFCDKPHVIIHYPEALHEYSIRIQKAPEKIISWVYNSNTPRQHRDIAFYGIKPDMKKVSQPYKNPNDKRIRERIAAGKSARLYDWWEINQVKNTSSEKTEHPCQMPLEVMKRIIGILPEDATIIDPFVGSGTTAVACKQLSRDFIGIDIDEAYLAITRERIQNA